jgi:fluoride exporter
MAITTWLAVALGSALGGLARYGVGLLALRAWGAAFPWGTLLINILGSFIITLYGGLTLPGGAFPASYDARAFVMVGICGGFTTFSSFSLQTLELFQAGAAGRAAFYILGSVAFCLLGAYLGYLVAARFAVPLRP